MAAPARIDPEPRIELGIDDALLTRLGRVVVLWGYVEMLLSRLLAQLCEADPAALLCVVGDLSGEALIRNVARLVQLRLPREAQAPPQLLLADADALRREYELMARGLWDRGRDPGTAMLAAPHPLRRELVRHTVVAEAELAEVEDHAHQIVGELTRLCLQMGVRFQ
jgi:hypothetical protein